MDTRRATICAVAGLAVLASSLVWPEAVAAQGRGRGRVAVARAYRPIYIRPSFYGGRFAAPWYGYWGPGWGNFYGPAWGGFYGPYWGGFNGPYWGGASFVGSSFGSVRVQVQPRHAEVFVDGYFAGHVDDFDGAFQRLNLGPGEHEVQVFLDGYRTVRERLYVLPGRSYRIRSSLERVPPGEPVEVRPEPSSAQGGVSSPADPGALIAQPPPSAARVPPSDAGRRPMGRTGSRAFGRIELRVTPGDAQVLIDGEGWQVGESDRPLVVNVPAGSHRVEVRKAGYQTYRALIDVAAGDTAELTVALSGL